MHGVKEKRIINPDDPCSGLGKIWGIKCALASRARRPANSARFWLGRGLSVDVGSVPLVGTVKEHKVVR